MSTTPSRSSPTRAGLWMLGTVVSFALMALAGRELSAALSTFEIQFWRSFVSGIALLPLVAVYGLGRLRTRRLPRHIARNVVHFGAQCGWFYAIGVIPLAEVFALEFTTPIWTALLAAVFLKERITAVRALAIALGFVGILVITRPGFAAVQPASLIVLGAAAGYAIGYVLLKGLTGTDSPLAILFYMSMVQLPLSAALSVWDWSWPGGVDWLWVAAVGLSGLGAHYCIARALACAEASVVVPLEFLRLPLIAAIGLVVYEEPFNPWILGGAALVLCANLINLRSAR